jgi:hypothetical protein
MQQQLLLDVACILLKCFANKIKQENKAKMRKRERERGRRRERKR